jgi:heme A synthase
MTRRYATLAWAAATATYLLIVFGAIVRITGSGMGCGDDWPLCNGHVLPPFDDPATVIEWGHRQIAVIVSVLVFGLAALFWWTTRRAGSAEQGAGSPKGLADARGEQVAPLRRRAAYLAAMLLIAQIALGAITVILELPHWTVVLHLGTAMLLLAALLAAATGHQPLAAPPAALAAMALALATVVLGGLTAKLGAGTACFGFPLCNGQLWPDGNYMQHTHWAHRLLAYVLVAYAVWWAARAPTRGPRAVLLLVLAQVGIAAAMVLLDLPTAWRAAHVAAGTAVWASTVLAAR